LGSSLLFPLPGFVRLRGSCGRPVGLALAGAPDPQFLAAVPSAGLRPAAGQLRAALGLALAGFEFLAAVPVGCLF